MKVVRAKNSGFCFGVKTAVDTAGEMISSKRDGDRLVMLGELTHNENVVSSLLQGGFEIVHSASEVPEGSKVIIRAHGITPSEKKILEGKNCEIIDRTCPFVNKIHDIVREAASEGKYVIVAGTKGHPEVVGICGEAPEDQVTVISSAEEVEGLEIPSCGGILVSQTTFSQKIFDEICENVENKFEKIKIFGTICITTKNRQDEAARLSEDADAMIVIGSSASSNTKKLYDVCRSRCDRTYLVADASDVDSLIASGQLRDEDTVGVTAGASTPEVIILEVVRRMDENKNEVMTDQEQTDINFGDYIESIPQLRRGTIVKGVITSADADYVYVDVRDKSEGRIPRREFANDPDFDLDAALENKGEVTVMVKSIRNTDQGKEIILSKSQLDYEKNKKVVTEAFENKTPITVTVTGVVKDGVIANFGGIDIYIHRTQLKIGEVKNLEEYKGQQLEIVITKLDSERNRLRVSGSRRALLAAERAAKANEVWSTIEEGKHYKGVVRSLPEFGAFVDIGGVDGLVHITELSWKRIRKPSDVLSIGDEIDVYVKSFDRETKKISLGYKKEEDDPYYNIEERIPVGSVVKGTVVRLTNFGAFVQLEPDLDALCHVSQISSVRLNLPSDVLSVGQEVIAKVTDIKPDERRISISIKEVAPIDPPEEDIYEISEEEAAPAEAEAPVEEAAAPAEEAAVEAEAPAEEAAPAEVEAPVEEAAAEAPADEAPAAEEAPAEEAPVEEAAPEAPAEE